MKQYQIFPDIGTVSDSQKQALKQRGLLNSDGSVPGWNKLAPTISNRTMTILECKKLILLELDRFTPRWNLLNRFVCYIVGNNKRKIVEALKKELSKRK